MAEKDLRKYSTRLCSLIDLFWESAKSPAVEHIFRKIVDF